MSKFFIQLLLSVMIAISAAVGFDSDMRHELKQTVREAKTLAGEAAQTVLGTAGHVISRAVVKLDTSVDASAKGHANVVSSSTNPRGKESTNAKLTGDANLNLDSSPALDVDSSLSDDSRTKADVNTKNDEVSLKEKLKSTLDLNIGVGN